MESMNHINSYDLPITLPREFKFSSSKKTSDLTVARVRDFTLFMKLIAKYDLWDEMEAELNSQRCTRFLISRKPMQVIGLALKNKITIGDLPTDSPAMSACSCGPSPGDIDAGEAGSAASDAGSAGSSSGTLKPGKSGPGQGDKGKGSRDKPQ